MNIQRGDDGIGWCDATWNPVTGCLHGCPYCCNVTKPGLPLTTWYKANREHETGEWHVAKPGEVYPYGFDPTFYPHRLKEPLKHRKPMRIFVVNAGDLFGNWVPSTWVWQVIDIIQQAKQHAFLFSTKNPRRYLAFGYPRNAWLGVSITNQRQMSSTLRDGWPSQHPKRPDKNFVSFEPLLSDVSFLHRYSPKWLTGFRWIIIGPQTGPNAVPPRRAWVLNILREAFNREIPVFMKSALHKYVDKWGLPWLRQFPPELTP